MFTKNFWIDAAERAIKTFAQVFVASGLIIGAGLDEWKAALFVALSAALASVLTSIGSEGIGVKGTASLVPVADAPVRTVYTDGPE